MDDDPPVQSGQKLDDDDNDDNDDNDRIMMIMMIQQCSGARNRIIGCWRRSGQLCGNGQKETSPESKQMNIHNDEGIVLVLVLKYDLWVGMFCISIRA